MKKTLKQWTAITCALVMIAGLLPVSILAEDGAATPTDLAPVAELVLEVEPAEEPVENTVEESAEEPAESAIEESVEEPATEPEEEKVTYTARIAAAKRDGKIFLTALVEPELVGKVTWEKKIPGQDEDKWVRIENDSPTLIIVPGSELIGKEIRFRLEDGTTPILNYIVPELEPEEAPEAGTEEPDVEINQEEPATDNEIVPAAEEPVEESADETTEEPKTEAEPAIEEVIAEEPAKEEQEIEDYETPLGLDDIAGTESEIQEEEAEEPMEEEPEDLEEVLINVIEEDEKKVYIYCTRSKVMSLGDPVRLTSQTEGLDGYDVRYQWQVDQHDGSGFRNVPYANGDTYTFDASVETLSWSWTLQVSYQ